MQYNKDWKKSYLTNKYIPKSEVYWRICFSYHKQIMNRSLEDFLAVYLLDSSNTKFIRFEHILTSEISFERTKANILYDIKRESI